MEVSSKDPTQIHIVASSADSAKKIKEFIEKNYAGVLQVLEQEGNALDVRYYDSRIRQYKKQVIEQAIEVIRNRIDAFGVAEPSISAQGEDRILVQLPGLKDAAQAKALINRTAKLNFRGVVEKPSQTELVKMIREAEKKGGYALGKNGMTYDKYIKRLNEDLKDKLPPHTMIVFEKLENAVKMEDGKRPYLIETESDLTGAELEDASVGQDEYGKPRVNFRFSVEGRRKFAALTDKYKGGRLAIVLDNVVKSAPTVRKKIDSSAAVIDLGGVRDYDSAFKEAKFIATALRAGALPAKLQQLEERTVGPSLGAESIAKGERAGLIGSLLVLVFMLLYYRTLGVVADLALLFNILLILAALTSLGATLTLPGVAGIVLTVGMAVDANVIIFERIKEELRKGVGIRAAVQEGFSRAFSAIFDSNITTAAACIILMYFGTGPVRGFAVTLLCGIITSMFTAIFVSRAMVETLVGTFGVKKLV
ncbi:MAG: protein translocase subunit SecD [Bdellovibrio sp.]|nr:MAG: protein translocase subunit SecD [Bdellovibrio sp.]